MVTPFEKFDLTGKTALVTGGATGLGFHMTRALARAGANVLISARRKNILEQAAEQLRADHHIKNIACHPVDLLDRTSVAALADHAISKFGGIDIFVGNAGSLYKEQLPDITMKSVDEVFQLNLLSNIQLVQAFLPAMREKKWGRILFSSSLGSELAFPLQGTAAYGATKGGLNAFCRHVAGDIGHDNITANVLVLGAFMTDIVKEHIQKVSDTEGPEAARALMNGFFSSAALGRAGDPAEVEGIVQLLASDAGSYITGSSIFIDGGMHVMAHPLHVE